MRTLLIKNGTVVKSDRSFRADMYIVEGKISQISINLDIKADRVINADGLYIIPGVFDPQVHFRDPGLTWKEDLRTATRSCAVGGVTSFLEMPNTNPLTISRQAMSEKKLLAKEKCLVNYNFFIGATVDNLEEINSVENVAGIKIFMGASTGDLLVSRKEDLERIFENGSKLIAVHAENDDMINENKAKYRGSKDFNDHWRIRSVEAAMEATKIAIGLSKKHNRRLHILHLTTKDELEILQKELNNPLISSEVCPQHMLLWAPDVYDKLKGYAQMNPPIRTKDHAEGLWNGLKSGIIDCMATDHAPHTREEKERNFGEVPSGMPGVETSLALMLNQVNQGLCSINEVVKWMCEKPAELYRAKNKGKLEIGYDADIAIIDMNEAWTIKSESVQTKCGWTPYDGWNIKGRTKVTIVNGDIVYENGIIYDDIRGKEILINEY